MSTTTQIIKWLDALRHNRADEGYSDFDYIINEIKKLIGEFEPQDIGSQFKVGDKVQKITGYKYPGVIVAAFHNTKGDVRYVVECTVDDVKGMLHIFSTKDLEYAELQKGV